MHLSLGSGASAWLLYHTVLTYVRKRQVVRMACVREYPSKSSQAAVAWRMFAYWSLRWQGLAHDAFVTLFTIVRQPCARVIW